MSRARHDRADLHPFKRIFDLLEPTPMCTYELVSIPPLWPPPLRRIGVADESGASSRNVRFGRARGVYLLEYRLVHSSKDRR